VGLPGADDADEAVKRLETLQSQTVITIDDAAVVSWELGKKKPKTRQLHNTTGEGALSGAFWGMFLGLIFFVPLLGAALGAALGAWSTSIIDMGISDKFIDEVKQKVTPGTSALFLLTDDTVVDKVESALKDMTLISSPATCRPTRKRNCVRPSRRTEATPSFSQ
jgi:uncharacterized membrane protein